MSIAILAWGSLIWDEEKGEAFDRQLEGEGKDRWKLAEGLKLPLEFSRISSSRDGALTLVIDRDNGTECPISYAFSKRKCLKDAVCDLMRREEQFGIALAIGLLKGTALVISVQILLASGLKKEKLMPLSGQLLRIIFLRVIFETVRKKSSRCKTLSSI